ncbi:MAG: hypothetical protein ACYSR9_11135 [Planctomycetota bacterium]|jgi:hypothetical protein
MKRTQVSLKQAGRMVLDARLLDGPAKLPKGKEGVAQTVEKVGYVRRQRSKKDRRKILIRRTEKDRALEGKYVEVSQQMTKLYYRGLAKNEIDRFEKDLTRILNNLTKFEEEQG